MMYIQTNSITVESSRSISIIKTYHSPFRRAYRIIRQDSPQTDKCTAFQMAVKAPNDSVGPNGLILTLPVLRALPYLGLPSDPPSPST